MNELLKKVLSEPAARPVGQLNQLAANSAKEFLPWANEPAQ
jgi:hypothetical protein